jgi:outer membrane protein OmpA-like peptidoglycan-associated protein
MGGFDVFKSMKNGDKWGQPENLGIPINGPEDDAHLVLTDDGKAGYYVSAEEGGIGDKDIYRLSAPKRTLVKLDKTGLNLTPPGQSKNVEPVVVAKPNFKFLVLFDYDKSNLNKPLSKESCDNLLKFMQENPSVRIELGGHTCNIGTAAYNQALSLQRAKAVANYMIERGIDANRIEVKGYNFQKPAYPNTNEKNRSLNRRTEFQILDK